MTCPWPGDRQVCQVCRMYKPLRFSRYMLPKILLASLLVMGGCATMPDEQLETATEPAPEAALEETPDAKEKPAPPAQAAQAAQTVQPEDYPVAPFEDDSLYELLVAEIAGHRTHYNLALEKYAEAARKTKDPGVAGRAARLAAHMKRPDMQLEMAQIWLEREPDDIEARRLAMDALLSSGRLTEAILHMEKIQALGGTVNFEVFAYRAAQLDRESLAALHGVMAEMLARHPDNAQLSFATAVVLQQLGRHGEALALAERLPGETDNINGIILKATLLAELSRQDEAVAFARDRVAAFPENRRLRLMLARLLFEQEDLLGAREQYEEALRQLADDGDVLFALGLIALELKDDGEAKRYFDRVVRLHRDDAIATSRSVMANRRDDRMARLSQRAGEAHYYLGGIAERRSDARAALREYHQVGNGYEFIPAQARIAALLADDGRWREARDHLARMRAAQPGRSYQLTLVEAQLLIDRGMEQEALEFLDGALLADPENTNLLYFRAMTGQKFGRLDILERDLRRILDINPQNADALNALGYTLTDQTDRHEEALALIEQALALRPDEAAFIDSMGWVQYRLRNYEEALVYLRRALELFPNDEVAAHLGEVLWVTGEHDKAREVWDKALELKPDSTILKKVIKRFQGE